MKITEIYKFQIVARGTVYNPTLNNRYFNWSVDTFIGYDRQNCIMKKKNKINRFLNMSYIR